MIVLTIWIIDACPLIGVAVGCLACHNIFYSITPYHSVLFLRTSWNNNSNIQICPYLVFHRCSANSLFLHQTYENVAWRPSVLTELPFTTSAVFLREKSKTFASSQMFGLGPRKIFKHYPKNSHEVKNILKVWILLWYIFGSKMSFKTCRNEFWTFQCFRCHSSSIFCTICFIACFWIRKGNLSSFAGSLTLIF